METSTNKVDILFHYFFRPFDYARDSWMRASGYDNQPLTRIEYQGLFIDGARYFSCQMNIFANLDSLIH